MLYNYSVTYFYLQGNIIGPSKDTLLLVEFSNKTILITLSPPSIPGRYFSPTGNFEIADIATTGKNSDVRGVSTRCEMREVRFTF